MTTDPLLIDELAYGGKGVARLDSGKICFIPGVLPGETVQTVMVKDRGAFVEASLTKILTPSPHRIVPVCPLAIGQTQGRPVCDPLPGLFCPGCAYQHIAYEEEVRIKQRQLRSLLARQAGCDPDVVGPPTPAPSSLGYRNKMTLHAQKDGKETRLGYFAEDNQTVLDVQACPIAVPALNARLAELRNNPSFLLGLRDDMTVTFRWTERDGAVWWRGAAGEKETWLVEATLLGPLSVPRGSFFQINTSVANLLLRQVMDHVSACQPRTVMDLYCGVGLFALAAAKMGTSNVIGADVDGPGIKAADHNARQLGLKDIRWVTGTAQKALATLNACGAQHETMLIVDPPRGGMGRDMVREILCHPPGRLLYISCAPDTLARDIAWLKAGGYVMEHAQLFDMFPRTPHFETVATLKREA